MKYEFDAKAFLKRWPEPEHLRRFLRFWLDDDGRQGLAPSIFAIRKWYDRGSIPGEWLARLILFVELETKAPVSLQPFFPE